MLAFAAWAAVSAVASAAELSAFRQGRFAALRAEVATTTVSNERARFLENELMRTTTAAAQLTAQLESLRAEAAEQEELLEIGEQRAAVLQRTISDSRTRLFTVKAQGLMLAEELETANGRCEQLSEELAVVSRSEREKGAALERAEQEVAELSALKSQLMHQLSQADTASHELAQTLKDQCSTLASELELAQGEAERLRAELANAATAQEAKLKLAADKLASKVEMIQTLKGQCSTLASELELAQSDVEHLRAEHAKAASAHAAELKRASEKAGMVQTLKGQCSTLASELELAQNEAEQLRAELARMTSAHQAELKRAAEKAAPKADMVQTLKQQCSTLASELELAQNEAEQLRAELARMTSAHQAELKRAAEKAAPKADMVQTLKQQCSTLASELELAQDEVEHLRAELAKAIKAPAARAAE